MERDAQLSSSPRQGVLGGDVPRARSGGTASIVRLKRQTGSPRCQPVASNLESCAPLSAAAAIRFCLAAAGRLRSGPPHRSAGALSGSVSGRSLIGRHLCSPAELPPPLTECGFRGMPSICTQLRPSNKDVDGCVSPRVCRPAPHLKGLDKNRGARVGFSQSSLGLRAPAAFRSGPFLSAWLSRLRLRKLLTGACC